MLALNMILEKYIMEYMRLNNDECSVECFSSFVTYLQGLCLLYYAELLEYYSILILPSRTF